MAKSNKEVISEWRKIINQPTKECCMCEGIFLPNEKVIEEDENLYCEACYERESDTGEIY